MNSKLLMLFLFCLLSADGLADAVACKQVASADLVACGVADKQVANLVGTQMLAPVDDADLVLLSRINERGAPVTTVVALIVIIPGAAILLLSWLAKSNK